MIRKPAFPIALALGLFVASHAGAECVPTWSQLRGADINPDNSTIGRAAADFTGDGLTDLLAASSTAVHFGRGTSSGGIAFGGQAGTAGDIRSVLAADVNGDGKNDAVIYDRSVNAIVVFPGNGDGTFGAAIQSSTGLDGATLTAGHFNGDGKIDLAFRSVGSAVAGVFLGNGNGTFTGGGSHIPISSGAKSAAGDLNVDGHTDLVSHVASSATLQIFIGNGNGTFDPPSEIAGGLAVSFFTLGDLDGDSDLDIVESDNSTKSLVVLLNNGNATFAAPVRYVITSPFSSASGRPFGIVLADANGDTAPDAIAALTGDFAIVTFPGNGDGTFGTPVYERPMIGSSAFVQPFELFAADVDGDGQLDDLLMSIQSSLYATARNGCGDVTLRTTIDHSVLVEGEAGTLQVNLTPAVTVPALEPPSGEVTLFNGTTFVSSGMLDEAGQATLAITGLPVGTHELHVHYAGDDGYHEKVSQTVALRVVSESETPAITIQAGLTSVPYGQQIDLFGHVTASGATVAGDVTVFRDGVEVHRASAFDGEWSAGLSEDLAVGMHEYRVRFEGSSTHPRSELSEPVTVEVIKAESQVFKRSAPDVVRTPEPFQIELGTEPTAGTVSLYDGTKLLKTLEGTSGSYLFTVTLAEGRHTLRGRYHETATHNASEVTFDVVRLAPGDAAIDVGVVNGIVEVVWAGSLLQQWVPNFGWMATTTRSPYLPPNPAPGQLYAFRAVQRDANNNPISWATDAVVLTTFSDGTLGKGTPIKAAHATELVAAINVWRQAVALTTISVPNAVPGKIIRAADFNALYEGMKTARAAIGMPVLAFPVIARGARIRAVDLQQLRDLLLR